MDIRHKDLVINEKNPFENCKLGRQSNAHILTQIVESYADGFVLAINNKWGAGKTTFVKMWEQYLKNKKFQTMHFNAWENDFEMEPLAALLGELKGLVKDKNEKGFNSLLKKAAILVKRIIPAIGKGIAKKSLGDDVVDIVSETLKGATEVLSDEIDEYVNKKDSLKDFKRELELFVSEAGGGKPIVFIIDELDRCRPDYAVEVLEKVKHFFSVPGIVFILSIDKEQLGYAIQGFYGSANIDTEEYLRRFIDVEYQLPNNDIEKFTLYLFEYYGFAEFFRKRNTERDNKEEFIAFANIIIKEFHYTLRQQEKLFVHTRIILRTYPEKITSFFPDLVLLLIHLKFFNKNLYLSIINKKLSPQELIDNIELLFSYNSYRANFNRLLAVEASLLFLYHKFISEEERRYGSGSSLFSQTENKQESKFILTSKSDNILKKTYSLKDHINHIMKVEYKYYHMDLGYFIEKIEILDNLVSD